MLLSSVLRRRLVLGRGLMLRLRLGSMLWRSLMWLRLRNVLRSLLMWLRLCNVLRSLLVRLSLRDMLRGLLMWLRLRNVLRRLLMWLSLRNMLRRLLMRGGLMIGLRYVLLLSGRVGLRTGMLIYSVGSGGLMLWFYWGSRRTRLLSDGLVRRSRRVRGSSSWRRVGVSCSGNVP